ncbi:MAG: MFS transporter [Pelagimonas sp.]|jgi:DHA1 family tetracycline resistance protein-like MFS transporter|nr:MFS transporter [Pelagimonas sp.]
MITVMVDAMGISVVIPVMPDLIQEVSDGGLSRAALWGGVLSSIFALMQFVFAPAIGQLSDVHGRRPVLLVCLALLVLHYVIMGLAGTLLVLIFARALGGIASATHSTASAAIADLSGPQDRARGFGLIGAAFGLGFVLGPVLGGFLGDIDTRAPFWAAGALTAANMLLGYVAFPETTSERAPRFHPRRANPFSAFQSLSHLTGVVRGLLVLLLYQLAFAIYPAIWTFFVKARFDWGPWMTGLSLAVFGISMAIAQAGLIRVIVRHLGERGAALFGLGVTALAFALTAVITNGALALALTPLAAIGGVFTPAIQAMMSKVVDNDRQGELQGVFTSTNAVAHVVSPLVMTWCFAYFTAETRADPNPGAPFWLALVLVLIAVPVMLRLRRAP